MKEIDIQTRSERSLFIDRFAQFIKSDSEIETVADLLIKNWAELELKKTNINYIDDFSQSQNKDFDTFCFYIKERFKNHTKNKEIKVPDKTMNSFNSYQINKMKTLSRLLDLNGFGMRGAMGAKAQLPNNPLFKSRLIESLKTSADKDSLLFNFDLFYSDSNLSLNKDNCSFGLIKIKVPFVFKVENKSTYPKWEFEDFRLYLINSIRDAMSLKLQELMSEQWSVNNLLDHNCNSLFVTDESFLEFFQNEKGSESKKVIDYLNGEERNRILNLFQDFLKS